MTTIGTMRLSIQVGIPAPLHQDLVVRWGVPWVEAYGLSIQAQ